MSDPNRPIVPFPGSPEDLEAAAEPTSDEARARGLPEHEIDENQTVGGGVMGSGGTAIDRGTGTLSGEAQDKDNDDEDDEDWNEPDDPTRVMPNQLTHG
jgi:hypothetical protein